MAVLFNKTYLNPNHYISNWKIKDIQACIEDLCSELQVDISYEPDTFSYYCISYYQYREICFWIHLFHDGYQSIIELEPRSGDSFGYVKIVSELRYLFQQKNMIYGNFEPYKKYQDLIYEDVSPEYIRSLIQSAYSYVESIYILAQLSFTPPSSTTGTTYYFCEIINSWGCKTRTAVSGAINGLAIHPIQILAEQLFQTQLQLTLHQVQHQALIIIM